MNSRSIRDRNPPEQTGENRGLRADGRSVGRPFQKGRSGNPSGRPRGSRNLAPNAFYDALLAAWRAYGRAALVAMASERPADFVRVAAAVAGRAALIAESNPADRLTDDQVDALIVLLGSATSASSAPRTDDDEALDGSNLAETR